MVTFAFCVLILGAFAAACSSTPLSEPSTTPTTVHGSSSASTTQPLKSTSSTSVPPVAPTIKLTKLAFFDPTSGFGLFIRQRQTDCGALVGFTTNGGAVFGEPVSVTTWPCSGTASVTALAFDDHGDGFAFGPDLFESHNHGATWSHVPQPGQILSVEALGSSVWMVEADCPLSTSPQTPCPMRLVESQNGGLTWTSTTIPASLTLNNGYGASAGQTWLLRISPSAAYLSSNLPFGAQGPPPTNAPLWFTSDRGRTWARRKIPCGFGAFTVALSAVPDGPLFAVCAGQPGAGNSLKSVLSSTDDGVTWATPYPCATTSTGVSESCATSPLAAGYLGGIDAVSASTVFLYGPRSSLLVTRDGGIAWSPVTPPIGDTSEGTSTVTFFGASDGVVLGYDGLHNDVNTIWSTTNSGLTWRSVVPVLPTPVR